MNGREQNNLIIDIKDGVARQEQFQFKEPINLSIFEGEQIAIIGSNGSGKSTLASTIMGRHPLKSGKIGYSFINSTSPLVSDNIKQITFRDSYGAASDRDYYYQQRWNSCDRDGQPKVKEKLPQCQNQELRDELFEMFGILDMLDKEVILLSSGELRRFLIIRELLMSPPILILDNPFIGLDPATREQLKDLLQRVIKSGKLQLILLLSRSEDIPSFITHTVEVKQCKLKRKVSFKEYKESLPKITSDKTTLSREKQISIENLANKSFKESYLNAVEFNNVSVRYGTRTILNSLSFKVQRGEKWAIKGKNGSGKSTLLSLISADNPQRYACDIRLFDKGRNSGQSIWQIKQRIGYVSPEMHRAYRVNASCLDIVGSGLYDTVGLRSNLSATQKEACRYWMDIFGVLELEKGSVL